MAERSAVSPPSALTRRTFLTIAGLGAASACAGGPLGPPSPSPAGKLYYGAATPPDRLAAFEDQLGSVLSCHRSYFQAGQEDLLAARCRADVRAGRAPLVSIKPRGSWAETARDDAWLDRLVEPLSDVTGPVFLVIHHEPEDDAARFGSPADYVAMQRAALARAARAGSNVTVVPVLSSWSFDERASRSPAEWNVEDAPVYGFDLYNPWSPTNSKDWVSFSDQLAVSAREAGGRPLVVGEYGCRSDPSQPGRAAEWMVSAFNSALEADIVAMAYFNSDRNTRDETWELDHETLPVFAHLLRDHHVTRV